jgi:hypothetical protein
MKAYKGVYIELGVFLNYILDGEKWPASSSGFVTLEEKAPLRHWLVPESVWML